MPEIGPAVPISPAAARAAVAVLTSWFYVDVPTADLIPDDVDAVQVIDALGSMLAGVLTSVLDHPRTLGYVQRAGLRAALREDHP